GVFCSQTLATGRTREGILLDRLNPTIAELTRAIEGEAERRPEAQRLMTHPGVGALTALAFTLIIRNTERFSCGKQLASYLGLVPLEDSSGNRRRLGHFTKQGTLCCVSCWSRPHRLLCAVSPSGAVSTSISPSGVDGRSPK